MKEEIKKNLSTPLDPNEYSCYYDDPAKAFFFLDSLDERDSAIYAAGYVQAYAQILEAVSDLKSLYLQKAMLAEDDETKLSLLRFVKVLDPLEQSVKDRLSAIKD